MLGRRPVRPDNMDKNQVSPLESVRFISTFLDQVNIVVRIEFLTTHRADSEALETPERREHRFNRLR